MRFRVYHPPVPLSAPRRPGEIVYTTLQLTRLRRTAINFQNFVIAALILMLIAGGIAVWQGKSNYDTIIDQRAASRARECHRDNAQFDKALKRARQSWLSFIEHSTGGIALPPEQQAKVEPFLADQEKAVRDEWAGRAPRPCTPDAIKAHYEAQR